MPRRIVCNRCELESAPSKDDGDFCQACFDHIEDMRGDQMSHARAAVGYVRTLGAGTYAKKAAVAAFLGVFHPEMSGRRVYEILAAVE